VSVGPSGMAPAAAKSRRAPWYVWVLLVLCITSSGPVIGGGYSHPLLVVGGAGVFVLSIFITPYLSKLARPAVVLGVILAIFAVGIAVADVVVTGNVLVTPVASLMAAAVLSLAVAVSVLATPRLG
jgi:hypothetical protein